MWIFTTKGYFSIVQDKEYPNTLTVRARVKGDIENLWPRAYVEETPYNDYRYRTRMSRGRVITAISRAIEGIDYNNFKDSIEDHDRRSFWYLGVWAQMCGMQDELAKSQRTEAP